MEAPLLQTKLYIPSPRPNLVSRPRLIERLDEGINARVQMPPERLRAMVTEAVDETLTQAGGTYHASGPTAFAPHVPHRHHAAHPAR